MLIPNSKIPCIIVIICITTLTPSPSSLYGQLRAKKPEVNVYLLGGQSNMEGDAHISKLPRSWRHPIANTYFWSENNFKLLIPGKTQTSMREGFFGPEIGFAYFLREDNKPAYLIKYAKGGMPLDYGWDIRTGFDPTQWHSGLPQPNRINFYPGKSPDDSTKGILYQEMGDRFSNGLQYLRSQNCEPVIKGFLWMQGEQDTKVKVGAKRYAANLKLLHKRLIQDLDIEELPMVFGQVLPDENGPAIYKYRRILRTQMAKADMASGEPEAISNAKMIPTDNLPLHSDKIHFNAKGQMLLGKKMAKAMESILQMGKKQQDVANN